MESFKNVIHETTFLTPKEKNLILRLKAIEGAKQVDYTEWCKLVYHVRFIIAKAKIMKYNMNDLESKLRDEFLKSDPERTGTVQIAEGGRCIRRCKMISITPF